MASDAAPAATVLVAGFIHETTGIDPDRISDVVVVYMTVDDKIGVVTYACCPPHGADMLMAGAEILAEGQPPDITIPCK